MSLYVRVIQLREQPRFIPRKETEFEWSIHSLRTRRLILCNENVLSLFRFQAPSGTFLKKKLRSQVRRVIPKNWSDAGGCRATYGTTSRPSSPAGGAKLRSAQKKKKKNETAYYGRPLPRAVLLFNPRSSFPHPSDPLHSSFFAPEYRTTEITRRKMKRRCGCRWQHEVDSVPYIFA